MIVLFISVDLIILFPIIVVLGVAGAYLYTQNWIIEDSYLIIFLAFITLLLPPIQLPSGLPEIRIEELFIYTILPFYIFTKFKFINSSAKLFLILFFAFVGLQIVSLLYGKFFMGVTVGTRDYFEIIKTIKYGILIGAISTLKISDVQLKNILLLISLFFLFVTIIGLMQYYGILGMDRITAPLYIQERIYDVNRRMMGTFYNPNTFSAALSIGFIITLLNLLINKEPTKRALFFFVCFMLLWSILLTQSRTGLAVLVLGSIVFFGLNSINNKQNLRLGLISISSFVLLAALVLSFASGDAISRYTSGLDVFNDTSFQLRLIAWYLNLQLFSQSVLFGWGPAKHQFTSIVDSEYILLLRQFGVIGFTINIIGFYLYPINRAFKFMSDQSIRGAYNRFFIVGFLMFMISNLTNALFREIQFMDFWCLLIGIMFVINSDNFSITSRS